MAEEFTLNEAAAQLGVHYMTAYKYVRTGRLGAYKLGGVWRVPVADLKLFRAQSTESTQRSKTHPNLIESRLVAGDDSGTLQLLVGAMSSGADPHEAYVELLGVALTSIGTKWELGELSIADEHIATCTAHRVIGRLGSTVSVKGRTHGTIVLSSVAGDHHTLPSAMMRDLLRSRRFDVIDLSANTPAESLVAACQAVPDLVAVGIVATTSGNEESISESLTCLKMHVAAPVVLGGGAIGRVDHAHTLGPCIPSRSARHALELFDQIHNSSAGG